MPNILKLTAENADELLNAGAYDTGALIHLQSSATEDGVYADLSGTGATPTIALVAGTYTYTGYDPSGTTTTWYRSRFKNAAGSRVSDWQDPFQAAPEGSGLLASLYDGRQRLGIPYTDTTQDENILEWLEQVTGFIQSYCRRTFVPDGETVYRVHTRAGWRLRLPRGIRSVTTLEIASEDQPESGGTYSTVAASNYYLDPPEWERSIGWPATSICLRSSSTTTFYDASYGAQITGTFGFEDVPADIRNVALNLLVAFSRERGASGGDTFTIGIGGERTYERALSMQDKNTLDRYRIRHV